MSLGLYMDEHVPSAITQGLRARGVDVLTAQDDSMDGAPDPVLLDRATLLGRVMFSQDSDLLREGVHRQRTGQPFTGIVYAHQRDVSYARSIEDLELIALAALPDEFDNRIIHLPLR